MQHGVGPLFQNNQVKKLISSYIGENPDVVKALIDGDIEIELVPQGTFAERIRCGGAGKKNVFETFFLLRLLSRNPCIFHSNWCGNRYSIWRYSNSLFKRETDCHAATQRCSSV